MAKVFYEDVFGNKVECDDEITALGPNPNLIGTSAESPRDLQFQPIRFHAPQSPTPKPQSGYSNPMDDPEYIAKFWPGNKGV
jgi:hypothetical protein